MIQPSPSRRGVAIPMALLVVVILTILLAAGFAALSSERRVHANDEAALDAFTLAETGLELFIAKRDSFGFKAGPPLPSASPPAADGAGRAGARLNPNHPRTPAGGFRFEKNTPGVRTQPRGPAVPRGATPE